MNHQILRVGDVVRCVGRPQKMTVRTAPDKTNRVTCDYFLGSTHCAATFDAKRLSLVPAEHAEQN